VGVGVQRHHRAAQEVLDEAQAAAGRGVVGVHDAPDAVRGPQRGVLADHRVANPREQRFAVVLHRRDWGGGGDVLEPHVGARVARAPALQVADGAQQLAEVAVGTPHRDQRGVRELELAPHREQDRLEHGAASILLESVDAGARQAKHPARLVGHGCRSALRGACERGGAEQAPLPQGGQDLDAARALALDRQCAGGHEVDAVVVVFPFDEQRAARGHVDRLERTRDRLPHRRAGPGKAGHPTEQGHRVGRGAGPRQPIEQALDRGGALGGAQG
jgi:hypothetical protein